MSFLFPFCIATVSRKRSKHGRLTKSQGAIPIRSIRSGGNRCTFGSPLTLGKDDFEFEGVGIEPRPCLKVGAARIAHRHACNFPLLPPHIDPADDLVTGGALRDGVTLRYDSLPFC